MCLARRMLYRNQSPFPKQNNLSLSPRLRPQPKPARSEPPTLVPVATYTNPVSHLLERAHTLRGLRIGTINRDEACDASFLLRTAATFHGIKSADPCPVCSSKELRKVLWVHGEELGRATNSARSEEEIERLADSGLRFGVHTVEVCPACGWNHILATRDVGPNA